MKKTATRKMSKEYNHDIHRTENANGLLMKINSTSPVIKDKVIKAMRSFLKKNLVDRNLKDHIHCCQGCNTTITFGQ